MRKQPRFHSQSAALHRVHSSFYPVISNCSIEDVACKSDGSTQLGTPRKPQNKTMAETNSSSGIKVFLHINGSPQESEKDSTNTIRIDRNSRSDGRVELNVLFPSMVGTSEAQLAAALISDAIEQLGRNVDVEMIQLSGLRFSKGGVDGLKAALSIHAFSVKHEVLTDIDFCKKLPGDQDALAAFSSIFAAFKLSGLNLSDNTIAGCVWRFWGSQSNLKVLML